MNIHSAKLAVAPVEERAHMRRIVNFTARVRELGCVATDATVANVSRFGCLISGYDVAEGAEVWLKLPGINPARARVIWAKAGSAGCEFYSLIDDAAIAAERPPVRTQTVLFGLGHSARR